MENVSINIITCEGIKHQMNVNLNTKFKVFLNQVKTLTGMNNIVVAIGDCIFCADYDNYTLRELGIKEDIDVESISSFRGGGCALDPFNFLDLKSLKSYNFSSSAPEWNRIRKGISFDGYCYNQSCRAHNKMVDCSLGFGNFDYRNSLKNLVRCPICSLLLGNIQTLVFYDCQWYFTGRYEEGENFSTKQNVQKVEGKKYVKYLGEPNTPYQYLEISVLRLGERISY